MKPTLEKSRFIRSHQSTKPVGGVSDRRGARHLTCRIGANNGTVVGSDPSTNVSPSDHLARSVRSANLASIHPRQATDTGATGDAGRRVRVQNVPVVSAHQSADALTETADAHIRVRTNNRTPVRTDHSTVFDGRIQFQRAGDVSVLDDPSVVEAAVMVEKEPREATAWINSVRSIVERVRDEEIRDAIHRLHPAAIRAGLIGALESRCSRWPRLEESLRLGLFTSLLFATVKLQLYPDLLSSGWFSLGNVVQFQLGKVTMYAVYFTLGVIVYATNRFEKGVGIGRPWAWGRWRCHVRHQYGYR